MIPAAAIPPNVAAAAPPNVLILFADDLGAGDLQVYGHPTTVTPSIDRLAASGVRFTQWYSAFHVCTPSRAAMLTGRLPIRSGLAGSAWTGGVLGPSAVGGLPRNETTFATALGRVGYASLCLGKWHLGQRPEYLPTGHGFDEYLGIPYGLLRLAAPQLSAAAPAGPLARPVALDMGSTFPCLPPSTREGTYSAVFGCAQLYQLNAAVLAALGAASSPHPHLHRHHHRRPRQPRRHHPHRRRPHRHSPARLRRACQGP